MPALRKHEADVLFGMDETEKSWQVRLKNKISGAAE
jgi:hypothetical protein